MPSLEDIERSLDIDLWLDPHGLELSDRNTLLEILSADSSEAEIKLQLANLSPVLQRIGLDFLTQQNDAWNAID